MIEIRTFKGEGQSLAIVLHNAETLATTYLNELTDVESVQTHAQTLTDNEYTKPFCWYTHIITLTITTSKAHPAFQFDDGAVMVGAA